MKESCEFCAAVANMTKVETFYTRIDLDETVTPGVALTQRTNFGAKGKKRTGELVVQYGFPLNFCPVCGKDKRKRTDGDAGAAP